MKKTLLLSCIFGKKFNKVHKAPSVDTNQFDSIFFTNNPSLKNEIETKGWKYFFINHDLTQDYMISSLQAKYIKFLVFLDDYNELENYEHYIYFDHKHEITKLHIDTFLKYINDNSHKSLIIRESPSLAKTTIQHEINAGMGQERYRRNMHKTKVLVQNLINSNKINSNFRICATGLLIYIDYKSIKVLLKKMYDACIELQQPECQILWAVYAQEFENTIKRITWNEIPITHKIP